LVNHGIKNIEIDVITQDLLLGKNGVLLYVGPAVLTQELPGPEDSAVQFNAS
jgi:hypothetical protein